MEIGGLKDQEIEDVMAICKKYSYGNVMQLASSLWRIDFESNGMADGGCFVPALLVDIKKPLRKYAEQSHDIYSYYIKDYFQRKAELSKMTKDYGKINIRR